MSKQNGSRRFPPMTMAHNMGEFAHDCVTLVELQFELLKVDTSDYLKRLIAPVALFIAAVVVIFGSVPVALHALALGLIEQGMSEWAAFLVSAGAGVVLALLASAIGWWRLRKASDVFQRSREEFKRNMEWFKSVLKNKGAHDNRYDLTPVRAPQNSE